MLTYSTSVLTKHGIGKYSTKVSDLTEGGKWPLFCQVYKNSADAGFILVCATTGREVRMRLESTHTDRDGDVTRWVVRSDPRDTSKLNIHPIEVQIFND